MSVFKYGIACSLEKDVPPNWPINLRGDIDYLAKTAKKLGYDGIELQLCSPAQYDSANIKKVTKSYGVAVTALATGREKIENGFNLISDDGDLRKATVDRLKKHIDLAQVLGSMVILGTLRSNVSDFSKYDIVEKRLIDGVRELAEYAERKEVILVVENILFPLSNYLNTIKQVTDFVNKVDRHNVKVHLDTYSMLAEESNIFEAINYCKAVLGYVHYSDSGRFYPGRGNVDFKAFTKALMDAEYLGYIVSESCPYPTELESAQRGLNYMKAVEVCAEIERMQENLMR